MDTTNLKSCLANGKSNEYSLKKLLKEHNISCPDENIINKFMLRDLKETSTGKELTFNGIIQTNNLPFETSIIKELSKLIKTEQIDIKISIDATNTDQWTLTITSNFNTIQINTGEDTTLSIKNSLLVLKIDEDTSSIDCKITGDIPFKIQGKSLDLNAFIILDTTKIAIGGILDGSENLFSIPSVLGDFKIDSLGLSGEVQYDSPSLDVALSGEFKLDSIQNSNSKDDKFTIVCKEIDSLITPEYLSFYINELSINKLFNHFLGTNISEPSFDFKDLNFSWMIIPSSQIILPNGKKPPSGVLNFSADLDICGLEFYGKVEIKDEKNFSGEFSMPPIKLGDIFSLKGDTEDRPEFSCTMTDDSPQFNLNAQVNLLDLTSAKVDLENDKLTFNIKVDEIIDSSISGSLTTKNKYCNLAADFEYGIDKKIDLSIDNYSLGSIDLDSTIKASFSGEINSNDFSLDISASFDFEGQEIGPISFDIDKQATLKDVISKIEDKIEDEIRELFNDATKWVDGVVKGLIKDVDKDAKELAEILHKAFGKDLKTTIAFLKNHFGCYEKEVIKALYDIGCDAYKVAHEIKKEFDTDADKVAQYINNAYKLTATELAKELKKAIYDVDDVAKAIKTTYEADARLTMKALKEGYEASKKEITKALKAADYSAKDIAKAFKDVYGLSADAIKDLLKGAGFAGDALKDAYKAVGGTVKNIGRDIEHGVESIF